MKNTFADRVITFNETLIFTDSLPEHFQVVNPFQDNPEVMTPVRQFYKKFYDDNQPRRMILGINPGRHGAAVSGVPFTDTKRLESVCGITIENAYSHELSSVFVYDMIAAYGGVEAFYSRFYINSPFPLAIIQQNKAGKWVNANYYDYPELFEAVRPFMVASMKKHLSKGVLTDKAFVLGKKNAQFIAKINDEFHFFDELIPLDHPRFIQQYKSKERDIYINEYIEKLGGG